MIDVAFTRAEIRSAQVAVVIDVLRATSSVIQALAGGYERVLCCDSIERAEGLRGPDRVLAGERDCLPPPGFDLGNSPSGFVQPRAREVVLATTNGAPTLVAAAQAADRVLIAALSNLHAVVAAVGGADVQLVCAGTDGRPGLDDSYVAGRIAELLKGDRTDGTVMAQCVAARFTSPLAALEASQAARNLYAVDLGADVEDCARESVFSIVPEVTSAGEGVVEVAPVGPATQSLSTIGTTEHSA